MNSRIERNKEIRENISKDKINIKKRRLKKMLIIVGIIILLCIAYSRFVEPYMLFVNEDKIVSKNIDDEFHGLKIIHFTDLHFGSVIHEKQLKKLVKKINELNPDIVIFTGDLIEQKYECTKEEVKLLTKYLNMINARLGKYAIIGNHDYYIENINNFYYDSNFTILNNSYDIIYNTSNEAIGIYGLENITYGTPDMTKYNEEKFKNTKYKILLMHEPDYIDNVINNYDINLILSGHSHNQQVRIPYIKGFWLPEGSKKYYEPYYKINNTDVYISNGLGTSSIELRFLSPPSINLFRITKK